jgi:hypothetical protein
MPQVQISVPQVQLHPERHVHPVTRRVYVTPPRASYFNMLTTLNKKINPMLLYLGLYINPTKPSAAFANLV